MATLTVNQLNHRQNRNIDCIEVEYFIKIVYNSQHVFKKLSFLKQDNQLFINFNLGNVRYSKFIKIDFQNCYGDLLVLEVVRWGQKTKLFHYYPEEDEFEDFSFEIEYDEEYIGSQLEIHFNIDINKVWIGEPYYETYNDNDTGVLQLNATNEL